MAEHNGDYVPRELAALALADDLVAYISQHPKWDTWSRWEAVREAIRILAVDAGAAQRFLEVIGLNVDLCGDDETTHVTTPISASQEGTDG